MGRKHQLRRHVDPDIQEGKFYLVASAYVSRDGVGAVETGQAQEAVFDSHFCLPSFDGAVLVKAPDQIGRLCVCDSSGELILGE